MADFEIEYKCLLDGIFKRFPSVQNAGFSGDSYKPGLERMTHFLKLLGNPHRAWRCIHVAGTNGKGSVCNMLASSLSASGITVGLYTSPHILDFRERARILRNSFSLIPKEYVYNFLQQWQKNFEELNLSFFEITTALAFKWFADCKVDIAVIEVGLGGRLDSTNVVTPELSIITSIGLDHCDLLGDTLEKIAFEKAGIIKPGVPVVIGEYRPETAPVFRAVAEKNDSQIYFAEKISQLQMDLEGEYQTANLNTVLTALEVLGIEPNMDAIAHTAERAGFHGRWETLCDKPRIICDIGHNAHALKHNFAQLDRMLDEDGYDALIIVYAVMADKDLSAIIPLMPRRAHYIFTTPKGKRALPAARIKEAVAANWPTDSNLPSTALQAIDSVSDAVKEAVELAKTYKKPIIYIGGSTFAVAEAIPAV